MATDWSASFREISGLNLSHYVPQQRSYNSVIFVHKNHLENLKPIEEKKEKVKQRKEKKKYDKGQQFNSDKNDVTRDRIYKIESNNDDSVLEQTIRFAKNIVPLVLPPSNDKSRIFYTIKTSKNHKKKNKKQREISESSIEREGKKKVVETYRKVRKESISVKESVSQSSNNTLDDINVNQSLCCTVSELSEKKYHKKDKSLSKTTQGQKFSVSESFEAVATEANGEAKIKIHLMNEKEKHFLSDSIKEPVLNAIKDCLSDLCNTNLNTDMNIVQNCLKCNSDKLDYILEKLTCIESKLDSQDKKLIIHGKQMKAYEKMLDLHEKKFDENEKRWNEQEIKFDNYERRLEKHEMKTDYYERKLENYEKLLNEDKKRMDKEKKVALQKVQDSKPKVKASLLEELGEDIIEIKENFSSEEELHQELLDRRSKSTVDEFDGDCEKKIENIGGGEANRTNRNLTGSKLERPHRVPARFCWTDAARRN